MDEKPLKQSLQDLAKRAKEVAEQIRQRDRPPETPPAHAITWTTDMIQRPPDALDKIEEELDSVAIAIDSYLQHQWAP
jgi:hypothetical protein